MRVSHNMVMEYSGKNYFLKEIKIKLLKNITKNLKKNLQQFFFQKFGFTVNITRVFYNM